MKKRYTNIRKYDLQEWTLKDFNHIITVAESLTDLEKRLIAEQILRCISDDELKLLIITLQDWMMK